VIRRSFFYVFFSGDALFFLLEEGIGLRGSTMDSFPKRTDAEKKEKEVSARCS
jgi:hypothetical protein